MGHCLGALCSVFNWDLYLAGESWREILCLVGAENWALWEPSCSYPLTQVQRNTHTFTLSLCLLANCVSMQKLLILAGTQVVLYVWKVYLAAHDAEWFYLQCWIVRAVKPPRMCFYCWNWNSEVGVQANAKDQYGKFGILLHSSLLCFLSGKCWKLSRPILVCQHILAQFKH